MDICPVEDHSFHGLGEDWQQIHHNMQQAIRRPPRNPATTTQDTNEDKTITRQFPTLRGERRGITGDQLAKLSMPKQALKLDAKSRRKLQFQIDMLEDGQSIEHNSHGSDDYPGYEDTI